MAKQSTVRHRTRSAPNAVNAERPEGGARLAHGAVIQFSPSSEAALKSAQSQQVADAFEDRYLTIQGEMAIVQPPYNPNALNNLPHENSMLRQCIEAMVTNIEGHGWRLEYVGPEDGEESTAAQNEKRLLEGFLLNPNTDMSLDETRARVRRDLETTGNAYFELARDAQRRVVMVTHVPSHSLRLTNKDANPVDIEVSIPDENGSTRKVKMKKKFRRFVQRAGATTVYFKEFGDPRIIDPAKGVEVADGSISVENSATEIYHLSLYAPGSPYGVPRWINQLPSVMGSRQAELTNLDFFRENAIPALAVLVSGGRLTQGAVEEIENHLSAARGRQSMNRVVVLEALGDSGASNDQGMIPPPRVDLKPLAGERQKDGFFLEYGKDCDKKIRSSFRLPPIFVGQSEDYSHATAKASYEVAESQVFGPARRVTDDVFNSHILRTYDPKFWELRSNPPRITDPEEIINALTAFNNMGALTPNNVIELANEYFDLELPRIDEEWGNLPYDMVKAMLATGRMKGMEKYLDKPQTPPTMTPGQNTDQEDADQAAAEDGPNTTPPQEATRIAVTKMADALETMRYALTGAALLQAAEADAEDAEQHIHVTTA